MHVIVIADYGIAEGGAPQVAIASAIGLAEAGQRVTYLQGVGAARDGPLAAHPEIGRLSLEGRDIWSKPVILAARDGIWNAQARKALKLRLAEFATADTVLHVHQWTKFFSPSLFAAAFESGLPLVVTLHDYFLTCPTGLMYRFDRKQACSLAPLSGACLLAPCDPRSRAHKAIRVLRTRAVRHVLGERPFEAIHVSQAGQAVIGRFLPPQARQHVLANPIECINEGPRAEPERPKLVYCGRLTEEKGVLLVAQAAKACGLPALFIGEGPMRDAIRAIDPDAEITGWLDRDLVRQRIRAEALALVAPSLWPETGPMVVAEALAAGVPAIVSKRAGGADHVAEGRDGFVVEPTLEALVAAVSALKAPERAPMMGFEAHRRFWAAPPDRASHVRALIGIYRAALQSKNA